MIQKTLIILIGWLCFNSTSHIYAQCDRLSDSLALISIFESTNGEEWTTTWELDKPINEWHGVELSPEGCVQKLFLNDNHLVGTIVDPDLPYLSTLWLSKNQLTGEIPNFENLPSLLNLSVGFNQLSGTIPDFSFIPNLVSINGFRNQLTGTIPDFTNLENLQVLNFSENQLTGNIPDFSNLPDLNSIDISKNNLTGAIPDFSSLPKMKSILAHTNSLSGAVPDFSKLPKLEDIYVYTNQLSGNLPNFKSINELKVLALFDNQLTGVIPDFEDLEKLEQLYLGQNQFSGPIPEFNHTLLLKIIQLDGNQMSGRIPDLSHLVMLEDLGVRENSLSGCYPDFVCNISFDAVNNKSLPWIGNHHPFCNGEVQIGAPCDDCNDNLIESFIDEDCVCGPITSAYLPEGKNTIRLYPNPAHNILHIDHPYPYSLGLTLYDDKGSIVKAQALETGSSIDISKFPSGIYIVKLLDPSTDEMALKKIIISH